MGVTSTKSGRLEVNLSLSGKWNGKSHLETIASTFCCFRNREKLHGQPFAAAYIFGDNIAV